VSRGDGETNSESPVTPLAHRDVRRLRGEVSPAPYQEVVVLKALYRQLVLERLALLNLKQEKRVVVPCNN